MRQTDDVTWGSAAVGCSGGLTVELDEAMGNEQAYRLNIDSPAFYLSLEIDHPRDLIEILSFLRASGGNGAADMVVGTAAGASVSLLRDEESPDRFFLTAATAGCSWRLTLAHDLADDVVAALAEVVAQLDVDVLSPLAGVTAGPDVSHRPASATP